MIWEEFNKDCIYPLCKGDCVHRQKCHTIDKINVMKSPKLQLYNWLLKLYRKEKLEKLLS